MDYILYIVLSYILGWFLTGYFVVRYLTGEDIRLKGSRNSGDLNSGRIAGPKGLILTFMGDAFKGMLTVGIGTLLKFPDWIVLVGLMAAVAGHIYPLPFQFKGGKGVSTLLGGIILLSPAFIICLLGIFLIGYVFLKDFSIAGLMALVIWPIYGMIVSNTSWMSGLLQIGMIMMIIWAHRSNLSNFYQKILEDGTNEHHI